MVIDLLNISYEPSLKEITDNFDEEPKQKWLNLLTFINDNFNPKRQICYSKCSAKPGWNVKYKKNNKALCTLYPSKDYFTALIVLNENDMEWFKGMRHNYSKTLLELYDKCQLFNGTKWLMIDITSDKILKDVKNLMELKTFNKN